MENIEKLDTELYLSIYNLKYGNNIVKNTKDFKELWKMIKSDPEILSEAVKIKRNKWNNGDTLYGTTIADRMLCDYEDIDCYAYDKLIETIYTNQDIARTVVNGYSNGGFSFLLMSLWNHGLKLTQEQKEFAVNEAMNKTGTVKYKKVKEDYAKYLEKNGIACSPKTAVKKNNEPYNYNAFGILGSTQAHGFGEFDIRYHILRNPNWTKEEKQKLIYDFYADDHVYDNVLEQWELSILSECYANPEFTFELLDESELFNYSYDFLLSVLKDKQITDKIMDEIEFCKLMHNLRPQQWELEYKDKQKTII